jgi:two-component system sensor histidine kinase QseC
MKSIRRFLITVLFSVIAVVMFITMLIGYQRSLQQAELLFENELEKKYQLISYILTHFQNQIPDPHASGIFTVDADSQTTKTYTALYQVIDMNNRVVFQSAGFGSHPLTELHQGSTDFNFGGQRWHALVKKSDNPSYWIIIAEPDSLRFRLADSIIVDILKPMLAGLFFIVLLVWLVVRAGFKPVEQLTQAIHEKSASDLSEIPADHTPEELQAISASVNALFRRLTTSFEREKRFTADAAHEMRNPITALKIHIDNLLDELPEKSGSLLKIKQAIDRLSNLVEQMLVLHRMSPDQYMANFSCINLNAVAQDVIAELYPDIEKKSQVIELEGMACNINADLFGIEVLIKNLITNAIKYTPEQGRILVRLSCNPADAGTILSIEDSGTGIPDFEKQHVFDRFYRVGGDRHSSNTVGSGLGLSIVKHIADLHQATIALKDTELGGLCVQIHFPAQRHCEA